MKTLQNNYTKNIDILRENLKRGMSLKQVNQVIDSQENQFKAAGLYNETEQDYIQEMRKIVINHFTKIIIN